LRNITSEGKRKGAEWVVKAQASLDILLEWQYAAAIEAAMKKLKY
jgi:hypothetical protein